MNIKWRERQCNVSQSVFLALSLTLLLFNFASTINSGPVACNKSRKIFDNVTFGEISHGVNSNYTQVSY